LVTALRPQQVEGDASLLLSLVVVQLKVGVALLLRGVLHMRQKLHDADAVITSLVELLLVQELLLFHGLTVVLELIVDQAGLVPPFIVIQLAHLGFLTLGEELDSWVSLHAVSLTSSLMHGTVNLLNIDLLLQGVLDLVPSGLEGLTVPAPGLVELDEPDSFRLNNFLVEIILCQVNNLLRTALRTLTRGGTG